jgi:hypothetical protein
MIVANTVEKTERPLSNMPNFDINVYNNEDYAFEGNEWILCPYTLVNTSSGWGTGVELYKYNLVLTEEEVQQLGLDSGDIWEDDDWIDKETLVREFGLSDRVLEWIKEVELAIDKQLVH